MNPRNDESRIAMCKRHPENPVSALDYLGEQLCLHCLNRAWAAGAAWADAHWADNPQPVWESTPDGRTNYITNDRYHNPNAIYAMMQASNDRGEE